MNSRVIHARSFVSEAVELIADSARIAIAKHGIFRLGLSGGSTPRPVYTGLARSASDLPLQKIQITFGDERCVPPDQEESNYLMAKRSLLDPAGVPEGNVFRMRGELPPEKGASEYENKLRELAARFGEKHYIHDLLLLGLGEDGHTASLFPGTDALSETEKNVVANFVPKLQAHRITFTYPLINTARHICFLVNDPRKSKLVEEILSGASTLPAARVQPETGELTWLLGF